MKFLNINIKVLLILCLFSGILFLSTGCNENNDDPILNDGSDIIDNDNNSSNQDENNDVDNETDDNNSNPDVVYDDEIDYSVWVANTTINTDKNQASYKVIWGDTLWLISTAWEVSYQEIASFNNIANPDLIYVDQIIHNPLFK